MSESFVCADASKVIIICDKSIKHIFQYRKQAKEGLINSFMAPYSYLFFWTKQRTREEAEKHFNSCIFDYYAEKHKQCYEAEFYKDISLLRLGRLLKACKLSHDDNIWLSIDDANLIKNWDK